MTDGVDLWRERLAESKIRLGRGVEPETLADRYDAQTSSQIEELTTRATIVMCRDGFGELTLEGLDEAAERTEVVL